MIRTFADPRSSRSARRTGLFGRAAMVTCGKQRYTAGPATAEVVVRPVIAPVATASGAELACAREVPKSCEDPPRRLNEVALCQL